MRRRQFCAAVAAGGLGSLLAGCLSVGNHRSTTAGDSGTGWPSFGRTPANTGAARNDVGPATNNVDWSTLGDGGSFTGSPTVSEGTVYVAGRTNNLQAIDAASGDPDWLFSTEDAVVTAPSVADGHVYAADDSGVLYAVTTGGEEVWRYETAHNLHAKSVAVGDDLVYVATAGTMPSVATGDSDGSRAGTVVAVSRDGGDEEWSYTGPDDWFTGPAMGDGRVYVGNHAGLVVALDAASGDHRWTHDLESRTDHSTYRPVAPPAYADGVVYAGVHGGRAVALDAASGDERWQAPIDAGNVKCSPAVDEEFVYVAGYRFGGGEPLDRNFMVGASGARFPRGQTTGKLVAVSRDDGEIEWVHERPHDVRSSPAVVGDRVYLGGGNGVFAVERDTGDEVWSASFPGTVTSSPAVADGRLYVSRLRGELYCIADE